MEERNGGMVRFQMTSGLEGASCTAPEMTLHTVFIRLTALSAY